MSMCLGKMRFSDKETAQRVADLYTQQSNKKGSNTRTNGKSYGKGLVYRVYHCPICNGFHHTTKPKRESKNENL